MFCEKCGREIADGAVVCGGCGAGVPQTSYYVAPKRQECEAAEPDTAAELELSKEPEEPVEVDSEAEPETPVEVDTAADEITADPSQTPEPQTCVETQETSAPSAAVDSRPADSPATVVMSPRPVSAVAFFFMELAAVIPVVGLILLLIWSLAVSNRTVTNWARARLLWRLIILTALAAVVLVLTPYLRDSLSALIEYFRGFPSIF